MGIFLFLLPIENIKNIFLKPKLEPLIECGLELLSQTQLFIKQYKIVLFYLIFDLEVLLLLPTMPYSTNYYIFLTLILLLIISIIFEIKTNK